MYLPAQWVLTVNTTRGPGGQVVRQEILDRAVPVSARRVSSIKDQCVTTFRR